MMKRELEQIYLSPIRDIMMCADQLSSEGMDVISFGAGDSDFDTPQPIKEAAICAIMENESHYETIAGNSLLRKKIAFDFEKRNHISYNESEVLITAAGTEAIFDVIMGLVSGGDEVIIISPAFINYENCVTMAGGNVIWIPVKEENGYQPVVQEIEDKINQKTKMIIINNPCNPTGAVYQKDILEGIAKIAVKYDLVVFSDEVYDQIVYKDNDFFSMAAFPDMKSRTIVANSFSKAFAMTGWRVGYLLATGEIMEAIYKVHHYTTACQPTFIQKALAEVIDLPETLSAQKKMVEILKNRRNKVTEWLERYPKLTSVVPDGAFYYFINVSAYQMSGKEFALKLLNDKYVAVIPGIGLGTEYTDYIRLSYAVDDRQLEKGLKRISEFLDTLD